MNNDPKINVNEQPEAKEESKNTKVQKILKKHQEIVTKYKIDYVDIALGIVICLLTLIIISPPLLRKFVPKASVVENEKKALILSCSGINEEEKYKITSRTKYIDSTTVQNIISYSKLSDEELEKEAVKLPKVNTKPSTEIAFFTSISGININYTNTTTTVIIHDYTAEKNTSNFTFMNYFQDFSAQKSFYTANGYTCEEIKS